MTIGMRDRNVLGELDRKDFYRIAHVMRRETGVDLPESKLPLVQARLLRRIRALRLTAYDTYCDVIEDKDNATERQNMVSALTTNVTGFFREAHHFDYLRETVAAEAAKRLKRGAPFRIWSAGCSSGEEPYSLAMTFLEKIPDLGRLDFKILGTDIDPVVLSKALAAEYPADAISRMPDGLIAPFVEHVEGAQGTIRLKRAVRDLVAFRRLNLMSDWPMKRSFDIIMCRNVVIYFGEETKAGIWQRLAQKLRPGGLLFTGHSERLSGPAAKSMKLIGTTTYLADNGPNATERATSCL